MEDNLLVASYREDLRRFALRIASFESDLLPASALKLSLRPAILLAGFPG
jgi:hypothetical protein